MRRNAPAALHYEHDFDDYGAETCRRPRRPAVQWLRRRVRPSGGFGVADVDPSRGPRVRGAALRRLLFKVVARLAADAQRPARSLRPTQLRTSRYLSAPPVLKTTTVSAGFMRPSFRSTLTACSAAPPSGAALMPSRDPSSRIASTISASLTASAVPPLSRTARRTRKSPTALGTRSPSATVRACSHISERSAPCSRARTIGAQ